MSLKVQDDSGALVPAPRNLPTELFVDFERRDDDAILAELQGAIVEEYVYSFRQGGQTVMGLSLPGVMAVAQNMGGITCGQPIWTITDEDITCDISATDHKVGLTVWGTASAGLRDHNGKIDKFARAKALSKAQRNAIRKVIPETVATQMLKTFIGGKSPERQRPPAQMQRHQPQPPQIEPPDTPPVEVIQTDDQPASPKQIKAIFEHAGKQNWTNDAVLDAMKTRYGKSSTRTLTAREAQDLIGLIQFGEEQPTLGV